LNCAQQRPSGRTFAPYDTATEASSLDLRSFLQLNNRQVLAAGQVRHDQLETLAALAANWSGRPSAGQTRRSSVRNWQGKVVASGHGNCL